MVSAIRIADHKRFTELVDSPYFNKNERVKRLWKWVLENPKTDFSKKELIKAIRMDPPSTEADPGLKPANFRMVLSDFVKLAEVFLLLEENDILKEQNERLIEIFKEKGLTKSYSKYLRLLKENAGKEDNKGVTYYNDLYLIECEELVSGDEKNREKRLKNINGLTDFIWVCMKLDNFIKSAAIGVDIKATTFYDEIISLIENDKDSFRKNHTVIYGRYLILKMFMYDTFSGNLYFTELEKYTAKLKSHEQIKYNYDALLTYCRMNEEYEKESALMKKFEKKGLRINENGQV